MTTLPEAVTACLSPMNRTEPTTLQEIARQGEQAYAEWSAHDTFSRLGHKLPPELLARHRAGCRRCGGKS